MPIYEYECTQCGKIEEALQSFSEKPLTTCNHCAGKLRKIVSHSSFHLKGSGWYVTDYAKKDAGSAPAPEKNTEKPVSDKAKSTDTANSADKKKSPDKSD